MMAFNKYLVAASILAFSKFSLCFQFRPMIYSEVVKPILKPLLFMSTNDAVTNNFAFQPAETDDIGLRKMSARDRALRECLSGFVVSLTTLPPSISYANTIGIHPLSGVYSSVIMGLIMSFFAGNGLIAGAAGVITIPVTTLVNQYGLMYMRPAILLAGLLEISFGVLKLGKLAKYVKKPVLAGFSNAFALFLVKAQLKNFMINNQWLPPALLYPSLSIAALCIACIRLLPKIGMLPSSLVGLAISSLIAYWSGLPLTTLADISGAQAFKGGFQSIPPFQGFMPAVPYTWQTLKIIFPTASAIAIISIIATSLVARIACEAKPTQYSIASKAQQSYIVMPLLCPTELRDDTVVGLGLGNAATSFFGGFGGCGLIPNTVLNTYNGGNSYISSVAYAISTALCVLLFAPVIGLIPMAALAGVMLNVASTTFKLEDSVRIIRRSRRSTQDFLDMLGLLASTYLCLQLDMGVGVLTGVLITYAVKIPMKLTLLRKRLHSRFVSALGLVGTSILPA